jgi:hypothetical protein
MPFTSFGREHEASDYGILAVPWEQFAAAVPMMNGTVHGRG